MARVYSLSVSTSVTAGLPLPSVAAPSAQSLLRAKPCSCMGPGPNCRAEPRGADAQGRGRAGRGGLIGGRLRQGRLQGSRQGDWRRARATRRLGSALREMGGAT